MSKPIVAPVLMHRNKILYASRELQIENIDHKFQFAIKNMDIGDIYGLKQIMYFIVITSKSIEILQEEVDDQVF